MLKEIIKKCIPWFLLDWYHLSLAHLAAIISGFPSRKLTVIGVTGTKGKSTTCFLIAKILEENGYNVGLSGNIMFKVGKKEWRNTLKMTMPGRLFLQRLIKQMVGAGCTHAIIETTSEGILQHRHSTIAYDTLVFTNLSPEHIERHGGFENYKAAKMKLFAGLAKTFRKEGVPKIIIANADNEHTKDFLKFDADKKITVRISSTTTNASAHKTETEIVATGVKSDANGNSFSVSDTVFQLHLLGAFNVMNALLAIAVVKSIGLTFSQMSEALEKISVIPGRMERIDFGQDFTVIVDYAYEPRSVESLYKTAHALKKEHSRIITITGSAGGGRDTPRRPVLGKLAAQYCDIVFVTNEDPYDDDPQMIIDQVTEGARMHGKTLTKNLFKILDRKEAIKKAFETAHKDDVVLLTGKGSEKVMAVAGGKYIPWNDQDVAREMLQSMVSCAKRQKK